MFFILLIFFREIVGLNANHGMFVPNILGEMDVLDFGFIQPRFNDSCDKDSLNAALECEAGFIFSVPTCICSLGLDHRHWYIFRTLPRRFLTSSYALAAAGAKLAHFGL